MDDELLPPTEPEDDASNDRAAADAARFGVSELGYPQILERCVVHALAARPGPAPPAFPWICQGPRNLGGRVPAFAQHPDLHNVLFVGTAHGGLWRSLDGGDTWANIGGDDLSVPVTSIAIPRQTPLTLYVATGSQKRSYVSGRGLYRFVLASPGDPTPARERLTQPPAASQSPAAANAAGAGAALRYPRIVIDPEDPDQLWIASQTGLWRCNYAAGGASVWTSEIPWAGAPPALALDPGPVPADGQPRWASYCDDVRVVIDDRSAELVGTRRRYLLIYAGINGQGVWRGRYDRTNGSVAWVGPQPIPRPAATTYSRVLIAVCPSQPTRVYALFAESPADIPSHVYRSDDRGDTWSTAGSYEAQRRTFSANNNVANATLYSVRVVMPRLGVDTTQPFLTSAAATTTELANGLAAALNGDPLLTGWLTAAVSGSTVTLTATSGAANRVFGISFPTNPGPTLREGDLGQADYDLVLEVHPNNPDIVAVGEVEFFLSQDGATSFTKILDWQAYNTGDRAQHADLHVAAFDVADHRRLWVGGDGGLSAAVDISLPAGAPGYWRKRSHGIVAGQFQDVATHRDVPGVAAGGLQDNAMWATYGGRTWYLLGSGDGGKTTVDHNDMRRFIITTQNGPNLYGVGVPSTAIPWLAQRVVPDIGAPDNTMYLGSTRLWPTGTRSPFRGMAEQDPRVAGLHLIGWRVGGAEPLGHVVQPISAPITVTTTAPGDFQTATFTTSVGGAPAVAWASPVTGTVPSVFVFTDAQDPAAYLVAGDTWVIPAAGGAGVPGGGNTSVGGVRGVPAAPAPAGPVTIAITTGGSVSSAWFTWQIGGGVVSAPVPVPSQSFALPGTGMQIRLGLGAYAAGDTWVVQTNGAIHPGAANTSTAGFFSVLRINPIAALGAFSTEEAQALSFGPPEPAAATTSEAWIGTNVAGVHYNPSFPNGNWSQWAVPALPGARAAGMVAAFHDPNLGIDPVVVVTITTAGNDGNGAGPIAQYTIAVAGGPASAPAFLPFTTIVPGSNLIFLVFGAGDYVAGATFTLGAGFAVVAGGTPGSTGTMQAYVQRVVTSVAVHPQDPLTIAVSSVPMVANNPSIVLTITGAGTVTGGLGAVAQYTMTVNGSAPSAAAPVPASLLVHDSPAGTVLIEFVMGTFVLGATFTIQPDLTVVTGGPAGSTANVRATDLPGGRVDLSYDGGRNWIDVTASLVVPTPNPDLNALPPGPIPTALFDLHGGALDLLAGTLVGVYRMTGLPTPTGVAIVGPAPARVNNGGTTQLWCALTLSGIVAPFHTVDATWTSSAPARATVSTTGLVTGLALGAFTITVTRGAFTANFPMTVVAAGAPVVVAPPVNLPAVPIAWRPFNQSLPLTLVQDMELVPHRRIVRIATFGRGIWDCDLDGAPAERLFLRQNLWEDGRQYPVTLTVTVTAPGALGVATFEYRANQGYVVRGNLTAASFVVPGSGVTLQFGAGAYVLNDRWTVQPDGTVVAAGGNASPGLAAALSERTIPALFASDPRVPAGLVPSDLHHAFDLRVARAPFPFFDDVVDGVEMDEEIGVASVQPYEPCAIYVQVHSAGTTATASATVRLYYSPCPAVVRGAPIPPLPPTAEVINATFTPQTLLVTITATGALGTTFTSQPGGGPVSAAQPTAASVVIPGGPTLQFSAGNYTVNDTWAIAADGTLTPTLDPATTGRLTLGAGWRLVATPQVVASVSPDVPRVVRFDWRPPPWLAGQVALLATVSAPTDALPQVPPPNMVAIDGLIQHERRAVLRIVPVDPPPLASVYVRDGIDDDGRLGGTAFAARSPDLIVVQGAADPAVDFRDLLDPRPQARLVGGVPNTIYVRITNSSAVPTTARVNVWSVALDGLGKPNFATAAWDVRAANVDTPIPAGAVAYASVVWNNPPDPNPTDAFKAYALIAVAQTTTADDPQPALAQITDLPSFWRYFDTFVGADNAALRILPWQA
jgi:hypothetical protein